MLLAVPLLYTNKTAVVCFCSYIYLFLKEIRHMQQATCRSVRGDSTLETRLVSYRFIDLRVRGDLLTVCVI